VPVIHPELFVHLGLEHEVLFELGFAFGVGIDGAGTTLEVLDVAKLGGGLIGDLDEGKFAGVEPYEGTVGAKVGLGVEDREMEGLLAHVLAATGTAEDADGAAFEVGSGLVLEGLGGHSGGGLDGIEAEDL
jgi:hypothetical protein